MSIRTAQDDPLKVLGSGLERTLLLGQFELEAFLADPGGRGKAEAVLNRVSRLGTAFAGFEPTEAADLAAELRLLVQALAGRGEAAGSAARHCLNDALAKLTFWSECWQPETPLPDTDELPNLIARLRAVRGPAAVVALPAQESSPRMTGRRPAAEPSLRQLATQVRPTLQRALLGILRQQAVVGNAEKIGRVLARLQRAADSETARGIWHAAEQLVLKLREGHLQPDSEIIHLLRDLDNQVKHLSETGQTFASAELEQDCYRRLQDWLHACERGELPEPSGTPAREGEPPARPGEGIVLPSARTLHLVAAFLREALALSRAWLDPLAIGGTTEPESARRELERLHKTANLLSILGLDMVAAPLHAQLSSFNPLAASAPGLLAAQVRQLRAHLDAAGNSLSVLDIGQPEPQAPAVEAARLLTQARDLITSTLDQGDEGGLWEQIRSLLSQTRLALPALEYRRPVSLLRRLEEVTGVLPGQGCLKDQVTFTTALAEVLVRAEYELEQAGYGVAVDAVSMDAAAARLRWLEEALLMSPAPPEAEAAGAAGYRSLAAADADAVVSAAADLPLEGPWENRPAPVVTTGRPGSESPLPALPGGDSLETGPITFPITFRQTAPERPAAVTPPVPPAEPVSLIDPEILAVFFEEAREVLAEIDEQLIAWRRDLHDRDALLTIRRHFHTLKGSGRMVEQFTIGDFAWCFENLLNRVRDELLAPSLEMVEVVTAAAAALRPLVGDGPEREDTATVLAALTARAEALLQPESEPLSMELEPVTRITAVWREPPPQPAVVPPAPEPARVPATSPAAEVDPELIAIFESEAADILDASDRILADWIMNPAGDGLLNEFRRAMHTLKGSSRMAGFLTMGNLAHAMESVLDKLAKSRGGQGSEMMTDVLQAALDRLSDMLMEVRSGVTDIHPADELIARLRGLEETPVTAKPPEAAKPVFAEQPAVAVPAVAEPAVATGDRELLDAFLAEAADILDGSDGALRRWGSDSGNTELLSDLRRGMHKLKGSSRMTGFPVIGDQAHAVESVLDALSKNQLPAAPLVGEMLQRALDALHDQVAQVQRGVPPVMREDILTDLRALLGEAVEPPVETAPPPAAPEPIGPPAIRVVEKAAPAAPEESIRVSTNLLNKLVNEMGEASICRARIDQGLVGLRFNLSEMDQTVFRLRQQLRRLEIETETQILFRYDRVVKDEQREFDPLELDRFSELQQLSRSLMEVVDDLSNIKHTLEEQTQEMGNLLDQQTKFNKEVQQGLMRTRMVRFSTVEPRLRRVVRQTAQELGKRAELILTGADAEVDRTVLESMLAPLEHMLRNSLSHGIEMPEQRRRAGKPETGAISLSIRREGAELVILLKDDGAGLNYQAIRAKAETMGMLQPGQPATEEELIALLMRPGFSTAKQVTQVSGRGVGMDVLNNAIKAMRGALMIQSAPGAGTTFVIHLPFSLVVTQALLVQIGSATYAIPLLSIESVARMEEGKLQTYLAGEVVEHRYGNYRYPIHNLGVLFGTGSIRPLEQMTDKRPPLLLFRSAEACTALQVDAVLGNQEIIIKPLGPQFQQLRGVSGATVLGDGRVVLVLELAALVRNLASQPMQQVEARAIYAARHAGQHEQIRVMVIDDSITMRKVMSRFLERQKLSVSVAKDGVEAVAKLEEQVPDLVILDIEMPRMDGFEVAGHIRNQPHLRHIPIIMVTSRGGDKHRGRAAKLGVNDYLIKPYQEDELLRSIRRLLGERGIDWLAAGGARERA